MWVYFQIIISHYLTLHKSFRLKRCSDGRCGMMLLDTKRQNEKHVDIVHKGWLGLVVVLICILKFKLLSLHKPTTVSASLVTKAKKWFDLLIFGMFWVWKFSFNINFIANENIFRQNRVSPTIGLHRRRRRRQRAGEKRSIWPIETYSRCF